MVVANRMKLKKHLFYKYVYVFIKNVHKTSSEGAA